MKRILGLILIMLFTFALVACGESDEETNLSDIQNRELDFRSVLHIETGAVLSLGDSPEVFESVLGEGLFNEGLSQVEGVSTYAYVYLSLIVTFYQGEAIRIDASSRTVIPDHFKFYHMSFDMSDEELDTYFYEGPWHHRYYDENGRDVTASDDFVYFASITNLGGELGITSLTIAMKNSIELLLPN